MDAAAYEYTTMRPMLFTDDGQRLFLKVRDGTLARVRTTGAIRLAEAVADYPGEVWMRLACVDRMVELGELVEVSPGRFSALNRIFTLPL